MVNAEIFKTVFKGYSKDEVVAYIDQMNQKTVLLQKELEEANAQLLQIKEEQKEAAEDSDRQVLEEETLRRKIIEEITPSLSENIRCQADAELRPRIEKEMRRKIEEEMASKYEEAARSELNQRFQSQALEMRELRRRAQLYDENREVLAELMIKAKNDAADIIHEAEEKAKALREDAEQRYKLLISDYQLLKSNLLTAKGEAAEKLNAALKDLNDFEKRFSCMDQDIALSKAHLKED